MFKIFIFNAILFSFLLAEDSVFLNNSLDSMTSSERATYKNTQKIENIQSNIGSLKYKTNSLNEKLESLKTTISLFTNSISAVKTSINDNKKDTTLPNRISKIENNFKDINKTNIKLNKLIYEISNIIDSINNNYIAKEQFESAFKNIENRIFALENQDIKYTFSKNNAKLMNEALSSYKKRKYSVAKMQFKELITRHYKPAKSNYYLGEINYFQKLYSDAIGHYKTSFKLYSKSDYIPRLLLHSGISLSKLNEKKEAKQFFIILTTNYKSSKEAKEAKKYVK